MKINNKTRLGAGFLTAILASAAIATTTVAHANSVTGSPEEQADITNWIANTPQQVSNNMAMQHINVNHLNGVRYVIQWGDTLWSISHATGISIAKLCYDNNIRNANMIYAGNVLILNRDGYVPDDFDPDIDPYVVAQTKVTINNGPQIVNINVQPDAIKQYYDNSNNSNTTNIYKANSDNSSQASSKKDDSDSDSEDSSSSSDISVSDIVDGLDKANDNDKLSFKEADDDSDIKDADELDIDSDDIAKDVKDKDYDDLLDKIKDALDSDDDSDVTIYVQEDGDEIHIYASSDKSDEDSNDSSDSSDSNDEDTNSDSSNQSEDTNDDTEEDDD